MGLTPNGRDWSNEWNWDSLGKFYAACVILWTLALYSGVAWLIWKRNLLFIKIRNLPLAVTAITFLHIYLIKIFLAYTTNGNFSCSAEFWLMNVYLPFGIALFQANLAQLRSISERQRRLIKPSDNSTEDEKTGTVDRLRRRWQGLSHLQKTYVLIGIGMTIQLLVTGILYGTTPTLRGDFASYGDVPHRKAQAWCRRSPQWTPTIFWQLFYSWCYGPYILYTIRNIHDIHHWRLQVILSVISGLPGAPLWLAAVYSKSFNNVNRRWVPPMWLAPGIIVMQFLTIFFPVYETIKSRREMRTTLAIIQDWEQSRTDLADNVDPEKQTSFSTNSNVSSSRQAQMHSMAGLNTALSINPEPLLRFAATKDFTAENISFLLQVRQWRNAFVNTERSAVDNGVPHWALQNLYAAATEIYINCINPRTSEFPINIESKIRTDLDDIFSRAIPSRSTRVHFSTHAEPQGASLFAKPTQRPPLPRTHSGVHSFNSGDTLFNGAGNNTPTPPTTTTTTANFNQSPPSSINVKSLSLPTTEFPHHPGVSPLGKARAKIPPFFNENIFDPAETSIKYLVLTNTWSKFVREASVPVSSSSSNSNGSIHSAQRNSGSGSGSGSSFDDSIGA